jgi:hypothetical protein
MSHKSTTTNSFISDDTIRNLEKITNYKKLTSFIAEHIIGIIEINFDDEDNIDTSVFSSVPPNCFTIQEILENFVELCEINETTLLITKILLDRFVKKSRIAINIFNIHK